MEKRHSKRHARRLRLKYGEKGTGFPHTALTHDLSATGMFVVASDSPKPGTRVHFEVTLPSEQPLFLEGVVARQVIVPAELRQVMKSGFGVRFLVGTELMAELVPTTVALLKDDPFCLTFADEPAWRAAVEKEFKRGGAFVWSAKSVAQNSLVNLTFDLRFLHKHLALEARVVHTNAEPDGRIGVALMFVDPVGAKTALQSTLGL
jgi:hypothetical protein